MLVKEITLLIKKKATMMGQPINPEIKIAISLRFLAAGNSHESPPISSPQ